MGFPLQYPIYQFFYWLVNTAGVGGMLVIVLLGLITLAYARVLGWVSSGRRAEEKETYAYPTPALHEMVDRQAKSRGS